MMKGKAGVTKPPRRMYEKISKMYTSKYTHVQEIIQYLRAGQIRSEGRYYYMYMHMEVYLGIPRYL